MAKLFDAFCAEIRPGNLRMLLKFSGFLVFEWLTEHDNSLISPKLDRPVSGDSREIQS